MFEIKKGKTQFVPVRMFNSNGDGQLGIAYTSVTASLLRADNSIVSLGISASAWFEASSSIFNGLGTYHLQIHSASTDGTGSLMYAVSAGPNVPAVTFLGVLKVVDVERAEVFNRIGIPASTDISTDIQNLSSSLILSSGSLRTEIITTRTVLSSSLVAVSSALGGGIDRLRLTEEGRWKIDAGSNTMTFYKETGAVWRVFALSGSDGLPSVINPFERNPIG